MSDPYHTGFWYLATVYSKHPGGLDEAFRMAARTAALLIRAGARVYSPIAHTHPVAIEGGIDPYDHGIWLPADKPFVDAARGLIVLRTPGWLDSKGIAWEIGEFKEAGKPIVYMDEGEAFPPEVLS